MTKSGTFGIGEWQDMPFNSPGHDSSSIFNLLIYLNLTAKPGFLARFVLLHRVWAVTGRGMDARDPVPATDMMIGESPDWSTLSLSNVKLLCEDNESFCTQ